MDFAVGWQLGTSVPDMRYGVDATGRQLIKIAPEWIQQLVLDTDSSRGSAVPALEILEQYLEVQGLDPAYPEETTIEAAASFTNLVAGAMSALEADVNFPTGPYGMSELCDRDVPISKLNDTAYCFVSQGSVNGIGYTLSTWPTIAATMILALYCVITVASMLAACVTGASSNSWDSAAEITALALHSKAPARTLGRTTAGLSTVSIFREPVAVKENEDAELELVFMAGDSHTSGFRDLRYNKYY